MAAISYTQGIDRFETYRLLDEETNEYLYTQNRVAFVSTLEKIPTYFFNRVIEHYGSGKHDRTEINWIRDVYKISDVRIGISERDLFPKATITNGMQSWD